MTQREGKGITTLRQNYIQDTKINSRPPCVCKTASVQSKRRTRRRVRLSDSSADEWPVGGGERGGGGSWEKRSAHPPPARVITRAFKCLWPRESTRGRRPFFSFFFFFSFPDPFSIHLSSPPPSSSFSLSFIITNEQRSLSYEAFVASEFLFLLKHGCVSG